MSSRPPWLDRSELGAVWERLADRLEQVGGRAQGRVTVRAGNRATRHALSDLLGVPVTSDRVRIDLAALERRLVDRARYPSLAAAVESAIGRRLRDRPAERAARATRRQLPIEHARSRLHEPWVEEWLGWLSGSGALARTADGMELVHQAVEVLTAVLDGHEQSVSRVEVAARLLGDAHALDEDTVLHTVVVRGLAAACGRPAPTGVAERRALWEQYGVHADLLSSTCLTVGLRPRTGARPAAGAGTLSRLAEAADAGDPVHLTAWDLRRIDGTPVTAATVVVCENPRVLEAIAQRHGGGVPVVCTSGQPSTVVVEVLGWLTASGCELRYHGDFDWPGIAIANRLVGQCGVVPWLMGADDYEAGVTGAGPALAGNPVEPRWDPELGAAMRAHRVAVHEEAVLDDVLGALG